MAQAEALWTPQPEEPTAWQSALMAQRMSAAPRARLERARPVETPRVAVLPRAWARHRAWQAPQDAQVGSPPARPLRAQPRAGRP
ncbi:MAG: hypothetical protein ACRDGN_02995, partial [bacterium]